MAKKRGAPSFGGVTDRGGRPVWQLVVGTLVAMALVAAGITAATAPGAYMLYVICTTAYTCGIVHLYTTVLWCMRSDVWASTHFTYTTVLWCV